MASTSNFYTLDEVMGFTAQNFPDDRTLDIESGYDLPVAKRQECLQHLREVIRQREAEGHSVPVDASKVEEKLNQLSSTLKRSASPSSAGTLTPTTAEEWLLENAIHLETQSYYTLINEGGIPSHPLDITFAFIEDPGEHKAIISYWESVGVTVRYYFKAQLDEWRAFRRIQVGRREFYVSRGRFPEYQQTVRELRLEHGYVDDIELHEDPRMQSKLQDWVEYQATQYNVLSKLKRKVEEAETNFASARREIEDAGVTDSVTMIVRFGGNVNEAESDEWLTKSQLSLARHLLEIAQSEQFGKYVERTSWIGVLLEHLISARAELENGLRSKTADGFLTKHYDVIAAKMAYEAECLKFVGDTTPRAVLVGRLKHELHAAGRRRREAEQTTKDVRLRSEFCCRLGDLEDAKRKLEQHMKLVVWIEQQLPELKKLESSEENSAIHDTRAANRFWSQSPEPLVLLSPKTTSKLAEERRKAVPFNRPEVSSKTTSNMAEQGRKRVAFITPKVGEELAIRSPSVQLAESTTSDEDNNLELQASYSAVIRSLHTSPISKAKGRTLGRVSSRAAHEATRLQSPKKMGRKDKPAAGRSSMDSIRGGRGKEGFAEGPVRRSSRVSKIH